MVCIVGAAILIYATRHLFYHSHGAAILIHHRTLAPSRVAMIHVPALLVHTIESLSSVIQISELNEG